MTVARIVEPRSLPRTIDRYIHGHPPPNPGDPGGVTSPEYLTTLDSFVLWLRTQPRVVHAVSLFETLKRLNMNMHEDNREHVLPNLQQMYSRMRLLFPRYCVGLDRDTGPTASLSEGGE